MSCQPWVIDDDDRITPYEWSNRVLAVMNVEAEAQEWHRKQASRRSRKR